MGSWNDILNEIRVQGGSQDIVRRRYLQQLHELTDRNVIIYYSGWLQKPYLVNDNTVDVSINDADKNGFMTTIHGLDRSLGLDLILHTPGGDMAATESLVDYLRAMFGDDIRAFIPQLAMSAGTMIACACKEIWMGKESSLGPIDPQYGGLPAMGVKAEFDRIAEEIKSDHSKALLWHPVLNKLRPSFITECENAIAWANEMVTKWLETGMFAPSEADDGEARQEAHAKAQEAVRQLSDPGINRTHARHINADTAEAYGLAIERLENEQDLQDAVLTLHHSCIVTLDATPAYKIIENHKGVAYVQMARQVAIAT